MIASRVVPTTSVFAGLLKPMWLSLIWTKFSSAVEIADTLFCRLTKHGGGENSSVHRPNDAGAGPRHAFQKSAAIDCIFAAVLGDVI